MAASERYLCAATSARGFQERPPLPAGHSWMRTTETVSRAEDGYASRLGDEEEKDWMAQIHQSERRHPRPLARILTFAREPKGRVFQEHATTSVMRNDPRVRRDPSTFWKV